MMKERACSRLSPASRLLQTSRCAFDWSAGISLSALQPSVFQPFNMFGSGLIQGLAVTAKNFVGSFHDPKRLVTTEYPEQKTKLPEAYRNFPFLVAETAG